MRTRHLLTAAACGLCAVVLAGQVRHLLADPTVWPPDDFVEYWAAAKLTLAGQNPYDVIRPAGSYPYESWYMYPFTAAQVPARRIMRVSNEAPGAVAAFPLAPRPRVTICLNQTIATGSRLQIGFCRARAPALRLSARRCRATSSSRSW